MLWLWAQHVSIILHLIKGVVKYVQTAIGVTCATLPTSSSACMMRLIRATGNLVLTSILAAGSTFGGSRGSKGSRGPAGSCGSSGEMGSMYFGSEIGATSSERARRDDRRAISES